MYNIYKILNKLELDEHTMSNKYILNLHYDDVESSSNPRQIHIESTSNPHRIDIESFCRFDVEILVKILVKSLSNRHRILCRFDIEILVKIDIKTLSNRRQIHVESTSNPHRIDIESFV